MGEGNIGEQLPFLNLLSYYPNIILKNLHLSTLNYIYVKESKHRRRRADPPRHLTLQTPHPLPEINHHPQRQELPIQHGALPHRYPIIGLRPVQNHQRDR